MPPKTTQAKLSFGAKKPEATGTQSKLTFGAPAKKAEVVPSSQGSVSKKRNIEQITSEIKDVKINDDVVEKRKSASSSPAKSKAPPAKPVSKPKNSKRLKRAVASDSEDEPEQIIAS